MSHDGEYGRILAPLGAEEDEALEDEAEDEVFEGEVEIGDEAEEFEQDVEEAREARGRRAPRGPTQAEKEAHELTHLPYRAWRSHCVRGCGGKTPHRTRRDESEEERQQMVPRLVLNYHCMSTEDEQNGRNPVLGMKDESIGNRYM